MLHQFHKLTGSEVWRVVAMMALFLWTDSLSAEETLRPNIVFIMADDMGYGDVQALNRHSKIPTPNLNRLAKEGLSFTDAHTPSAVCTPTRYGVLTGRYCWRSRLKKGVQNGYGTPLIEKDRPTVASFLQTQGYRTGIVGKWHLGLDFARDGERYDYSKPLKHTPTALGFDESFIIPASLDFPPYVYLKNERVTEIPEITQPAQRFPAFLRKGPRSSDLVMEDCLDDLLKQANDFITRHAKDEKPFFLYFPLTAPHKPVLPHPRFRGKSKLGPYGDFVMQVDATVGGLLQTLDEQKLTENTLVIYTSDNGSFMYRYDDASKPDHLADPSVQAYSRGHHTANAHFRGTKADIYEGGHRVPFLVRWPNRIKAGGECSDPVCLVDFFATCADLVEAKVADNAAPDSYSFLPLLYGKERTTPRAPIIHHSVAGMFSIRHGDWKLVLGNGSGGRAAPRGKPFEKPYQLFNLKTDPQEQHNVIDDYPKEATLLEELCQKIINQEGSR